MTLDRSTLLLIPDSTGILPNMALLRKIDMGMLLGRSDSWESGSKASRQAGGEGGEEEGEMTSLLQAVVERGLREGKTK